jgi:hypothetical protein
MVIDSAPTASPQLMDPAAIWCAMSCTALSPELQKRLHELAAVVLGKPAASEAARQ